MHSSKTTSLNFTKNAYLPLLGYILPKKISILRQHDDMQSYHGTLPKKKISLSGVQRKNHEENPVYDETRRENEHKTETGHVRNEVNKKKLGLLGKTLFFMQ